MKRLSSALLAAMLALSVPLHAGETKTWSQETFADFEKAERKRLALRSDGLLTLAPALAELHDPSLAALWAVVTDSKGNVYVGGAASGGVKSRLIRLDPAGAASTVAELDGLAIQALAVDARDRIYAATSPDGKVYRVENGQAAEFYDPQAKYIWSLAVTPTGDVFVGTGDKGEIHRVTADGRGAVFFRTGDAHARSLALDAAGHLIAGTEPGGLVLRITPGGAGFVLFQFSKREITALVTGRDGSIYAAGAGSRAAAPSVPPTPPPTAPSSPSTAPASPGAIVIGQRTPTPTTAPPPSVSAAPAISGGSEVYRIEPDGYPRRLWSHSQDVVYAIALDGEGRPWIATGNRGALYRIDSEILHTLLLNVAPTQITGLAATPQGAVYAVTANIGKVYRIGPGLEKEGILESEIFDAGGFSFWGRLYQSSRLNGGVVRFETRSGNSSRTQFNWSSWTAPDANRRAVSPPARFVQYRAMLSAAPDGKSPELAYVELAYLGKNVAPLVEEIEMTPPNYRFPAPASSLLTPSATLSLPTLNRRRSASASTGGSTPAEPSTTSPAMNLAKGFLGARWLAGDDNGDTLEFSVDMRGAQEAAWKPLRDKIRDRYFSFDSTTFPDGEYVLRVTASDAPSNPPVESLKHTLEGPAFLIDNTPPRILDLATTVQGSRIEIRWRAVDALSVLGKAEYSVNGGEWLVAAPVTRLTDSAEHEYRLTIERPSAGEVTIAVRVADGYDNQSVEKVVVR
jgi:hypothetical protein